MVETLSKFQKAQVERLKNRGFSSETFQTRAEAEAFAYGLEQGRDLWRSSLKTLIVGTTAWYKLDSEDDEQEECG